MKKLVLGIGILALSAVSFSATSTTKNVNVNVGANIVASSIYEIYIYEANVQIPGAGIAMIHANTAQGSRVQPKSKTLAAMLRPAQGGNAIPLINGTDTVNVSFQNPILILEREGGKVGGVDEFTSDLTVVNSGGFVNNNEKQFTITSTPDSTSAQAVVGNYSGTAILTVTINKN